jgi:hypothetical protein
METDREEGRARRDYIFRDGVRCEIKRWGTYTCKSESAPFSLAEWIQVAHFLLYFYLETRTQLFWAELG